MPGTERAAIAAKASGTRKSMTRWPRSLTWMRTRRPLPGVPARAAECVRASGGGGGAAGRPSASMIGAASSGLSLPSLTSRRTVVISSPISVLPGQSAGRLVHVDLTALQGLEDVELGGCVRHSGNRPRRGPGGGDGRRADPTGAADRDVAGHRVEDECRTARADDQPASIRSALQPVVEFAVDVGREATHLEGGAAHQPDHQVAADRLDAKVAASR